MTGNILVEDLNLLKHHCACGTKETFLQDLQNFLYFLYLTIKFFFTITITKKSLRNVYY